MNNIITLTKENEYYPSEYIPYSNNYKSIYAVGNLDLLTEDSHSVAVYGNSHSSDEEYSSVIETISQYISYNYAIAMILERGFGHLIAKEVMQRGGKFIAVIMTSLERVKDNELVHSIIDNNGLVLCLSKTIAEERNNTHATSALLGGIVDEYYVASAATTDLNDILVPARRYHRPIQIPEKFVTNQAYDGLAVINEYNKLTARIADTESTRKKILIIANRRDMLTVITQMIMQRMGDCDVNILFWNYYTNKGVINTILSLNPDAIVLNPNDGDNLTHLFNMWDAEPKTEAMTYYYFPGLYLLSDIERERLRTGNKFEHEDKIGDHFRKVIKL